MLVPPSAGVEDAAPPGPGLRMPLPQQWHAGLVFVMVALAHSLSLAGSQLCGYSMYSER